MIGKTRDSIQVKRDDGTVIKLAVNPFGIVVMCEDTVRHQTETLTFNKHPELRDIYDEGWVLPEVSALVDQVEIRSVRLPK